MSRYFGGRFWAARYWLGRMFHGLTATRQAVRATWRGGVTYRATWKG